MSQKALRLAVGMVSASFFLAGLLGAATLAAAPSGAFEPDHASEFGVDKLVNSSKFLRNWDCGCPSLANRPSVLSPPKNFDRNAYPARCFKENHTRNLRAAAGGGAVRPYNNAGVLWPSVQYPKGFPANSSVNPHPKTYDTIPFPGWPLRRSYDPAVKWDDDARTEYRDWYKKEGTPPADKDVTPPNPIIPSWFTVASSSGSKPKKYRAGWQHYQIHHIFERRFGGENGKGNLVPAYSKRGSNLHQEYTTWWTQTKVDFDIRKIRTKQAKEIWAEISKCH